VKDTSINIAKLIRPKIIITENEIFIRDRLFGWRLFLFLLGVLFVIYSVYFKTGDDQAIGVIFGLIWSIVFLYDCVSLKRVRIDLKARKLYRRSLNPIENLLDWILQHPSTIPYENIDIFFSDYTEVFASAVQRYYVYLKTNDPYKLKIGTFKTLADSEIVVRFLNNLISRSR
jgi:hypothetical protein